ncbi:MAG: phosphotransferase [Gammaproteobacteria bacterium]|nr:phosphotransferase [Gammaproteobacteria bacterium]MCF6229185.1 phosphotransferase [Gammaproteobacteria bacterium]
MQRFERLNHWLKKSLNESKLILEPVSGDASFRRYFRITASGQSYIVMDAPPSHEEITPFIRITRLFEQAGLNVPQLYAEDIENGFLLLGDLGREDYLSALNDQSANRLYDDAISTLLTLQSACRKDKTLPDYGEQMLQSEMMLFSEWFLGQHLKVELSCSEHDVLQQSFSTLISSALAQPKVCVHRDYHSRNLMVCATHNPGVIDYQDAVMGPISYDLVSLLRDCYIGWPDTQIYSWVHQYYQRAFAAGLLTCDEPQFVKWFDLMGMQRHLKAIGIFARLNYRDGKPNYLDDIPRTFNYLLKMTEKYPQFSEMASVLKLRSPNNRLTEKAG